MLAADIRAFVAAMPAVETQRDIIKRRLAAQFTVKTAPMQTIPGQATPTQNAGQQKGADPAAPSGIDAGF